MSFIVEQESFSGPLMVLLDLLDKDKLEIKDLSLAQIADDYLLYLENDTVPPDQLADFLLIASRLIYLKSKELMPYLRLDDEEEEIESLEDQLRLYRLFIRAAKKLEHKFSEGHVMFSRPNFKKEIKLAFRPAKNISCASLNISFMDLLKRLEPFFVLQQVSIERVKSVEERLDELKDAIISRSKISFSDIAHGAKRKIDVVISFLALLELMRRQIVRVKQNDQDIIIERI